MTTLYQGLDLAGSGVISIVGAGGKTSLMFRLAHELAAAGESVLTTTTTKIQHPSVKQSNHLVISDSPENVLRKAKGILRHSLHLSAAAKVLSQQEKLVGFPPDVIQIFWESGYFRWIIVEADGAKKLPLKAPASHEPVIPRCSNRVIGVLGLSALGKTLDHHTVFRPELVAGISSLEPGMDIVTDTLCSVLSHRLGIFKGTPASAKKIAFLNQADIPSLANDAQLIMDTLCGNKRSDLSRVVIGSTRINPAVIKYLDLNS